jgi:hypothetical protein
MRVLVTSTKRGYALPQPPSGTGDLTRLWKHWEGDDCWTRRGIDAEKWPRQNAAHYV